MESSERCRGSLKESRGKNLIANFSWKELQLSSQNSCATENFKSPHKATGCTNDMLRVADMSIGACSDNGALLLLVEHPWKRTQLKKNSSHNSEGIEKKYYQTTPIAGSCPPGDDIRSGNRRHAPNSIAQAMFADAKCIATHVDSVLREHIVCSIKIVY